MPAAYLDLGTETISLCAGCGHIRVSTPVCAMTDVGVAEVGVMTTCRCGPLFRCRTCRAAMPQDGPTMFDHLVFGHG